MQRSNPKRNLRRSNQQPVRKGRKRISYLAAGRQLKGDVAKVMSYLPALKALINVEDKYIDTQSLATSVGTTPTQILLNGCTQGTTPNTRVGISIKCVNLEVILTYKIDDAATATPTNLRSVIVRDLQCNGATFGATTYWVSANYYSFTNVSNQQRFYTFYDEIITLSPNGPESLVARAVIPLGFHVDYGSGNAGTIADISTNALIWMCVSDDNVNTPSVDANFRLWFVDN